MFEQYHDATLNATRPAGLSAFHMDENRFIPHRTIAGPWRNSLWGSVSLCSLGQSFTRTSCSSWISAICTFIAEDLLRACEHVIVDSIPPGATGERPSTGY